MSSDQRIFRRKSGTVAFAPGYGIDAIAAKADTLPWIAQRAGSAPLGHGRREKLRSILRLQDAVGRNPCISAPDRRYRRALPHLRRCARGAVFRPMIGSASDSVGAFLCKDAT